MSPVVLLVGVGHEQRLVEHLGVHVRVWLEGLGHDVVQPPDGVAGDGGHRHQERLVRSDVLPVPAAQRREGLPHLQKIFQRLKQKYLKENTK